MDFRAYIDQATTIALISHVSPDGDNLGCLTGLAESLRQLGKDVRAICLDEIPYNLKFLYGIDKLSKEWEKDFDLLITLDSSSIDRFGPGQDIVNKAKYKINIDHHISNNLDFDLNIVKADYSSTGEVLYELIKAYDLPIDINIAESIYTAISSDTGSFKYDSCTTRTFKIAAELLEFGIDLNKINTNLYSKNSLEKVKVLSTILNRLVIDKKRAFAYSYILKEDLKKLGAVESDADGSVEFIRDIDGIEVAMVLKEIDGGFKGSLRSKFDKNVAELAQKFSGGGHIKAAGFTILEKNLDKAIEEILNNYDRL